MPNNLKLRQLEGFVAAADTGSFTAAASTMAMTPPAFSQLIRELESTLGLTLFERTTRRLVLTPSGRQLLEGVRRPLDDLAQVSLEMKALAGGRTGTVVMSILHSLAFGLGTRALSELKAAQPDVVVRMIEDQNDVLIERVRSREVDFGLGMFTEAFDDIEFTPLFEDELVAVFSVDHPLRSRRVLSWHDLAQVPLILLQPKSSVRRLVESSLTVTGTPRHHVTEVVSMVTAINMAAAGFGVTILPQLSLASLKMTGMAVRKIRDPRPRRQIGLLRKVGRTSSRAEALAVDRIGEGGGAPPPGMTVRRPASPER